MHVSGNLATSFAEGKFNVSKLSYRLVNIFGAMALGVTDQVRSATGSGMQLGGEAPAALVMIGHVPGLSIDQLGRVVRLSQAGTVRLVDRLASAGLAERRAAPNDRRMVALYLTALGDTQRRALLDRRRQALREVLDAVTVEDLAALERVADAVLQQIPGDAQGALTICRFCNKSDCADCPMNIFGPI